MKTVSDIAQLRFRSILNPNEYGVMALSDDGTFRIVPSDDLRDEMAKREEEALKRSQKWGLGTGVVFLTLGALFVGLGWFLGRVFGKIGSSLSSPRPVQDVKITRDEGGGIHLFLHGLENRFQSIQMGWNGDEVLIEEADAFVKKLEEMQSNTQG